MGSVSLLEYNSISYEFERNLFETLVEYKLKTLAAHFELKDKQNH